MSSKAVRDALKGFRVGQVRKNDYVWLHVDEAIEHFKRLRERSLEESKTAKAFIHEGYTYLSKTEVRGMSKREAQECTRQIKNLRPYKGKAVSVYVVPVRGGETHERRIMLRNGKTLTVPRRVLEPILD